MPQSKSVCILLLNWNGWRDTIECLESVMKSDYSNFRIVLCDNGSSDSSLEHIQTWANDLRINSDFSYAHYNRIEAESGGRKTDKSKLVLIQNGTNLGFGGGNNVGLRYVLARDDFDFAWLLNTDTVVNPDSLSKLIERATKDEHIGITGSTSLYYHNPQEIQTLGGGIYNKWFGLPNHLHAHEIFKLPVNEYEIELQMQYVYGASMLVSKRFLQEVGLMCENYFLYFEELDWAIRGKEKGFLLGYASESVIYHKDGQSVGNKPDSLSLTSVYYGVKSRMKFGWRFFPFLTPLIYLRLWVSIMNQLGLGRAKHALTIFKAMHGFRLA